MAMVANRISFSYWKKRREKGGNKMLVTLQEAYGKAAGGRRERMGCQGLKTQSTVNWFKTQHSA